MKMSHPPVGVSACTEQITKYEGAHIITFLPRIQEALN